MDWTEIIIQTPAAYGDTVAAIANMAVPGGIYIEDYTHLEQEIFECAHVDLIDQELLEKDRQNIRVHLYISPEESPLESLHFLKERFCSEQIPHTVQSIAVKEEDWAEVWKQYYKPMRIGPRLLVCPSWEQCSPTADEVVLTLDPGMAFGTGTHETTRLCLELLQRFPQDGRRVLDIGCGSGILGVTAALFGAQEVVGCDIDPLAVKTANENAAANGVSTRARFAQGSLAQGISGRFDVICANIIADVIISLCPNILSLLKPGGVFIASGIIDTRKDDVIQALEPASLEPVMLLEDRGWVAFAAKAAGAAKNFV